MTKKAKNAKRSVYFPSDMFEELLQEMERTDRTFSWIIQRCVKIAMPEIRALPSINDPEDGE